MGEFGDKVSRGWHRAIAWVDTHPKTALIIFCAVVGAGVVGWLV